MNRSERFAIARARQRAGVHDFPIILASAFAAIIVGLAYIFGGA